MRHMRSSRMGTQPNHTHFCPISRERISSTGCEGCAYLFFIHIHDVSHEVDCTYPADESLFQFEPAHAVDKGDLPAYLGGDPLRVSYPTYMEPKVDGVRAIIHFTKDGIRITGRRKNREGTYSEFTDNVPHIADLEFPSTVIGTVLDAEILVQPFGSSATGNVPTGSLGATMGVVGSEPTKAIETQRRMGYAHLWIFDVVKVNGIDVRTEPFAARLADLQSIMRLIEPACGEFLHQMPGWICNDPISRWRNFEDYLTQGYEGAMLKDLEAPYGSTYALLKVKQTVTVDALVTGFEYGSKGGKYQWQVGTLLLSVVDKATGRLREIAKAVPGSDILRRSLTDRFLVTSDVSSLGILVELEAQVFTKEYRLRHPRILRYRTDKSDATVLDFTTVVRA